MRKEYDFSNAIQNPYEGRLKRQVTIRLEADTVDYFKQLATETGLPYQNLISLYLRECAASKRKISFQDSDRNREK